MANTSSQDWLFSEPKNVAVYTTSDVMENRSPILFVPHDIDDGAWQFHSAQGNDCDEPKVVALKRIVDLDHSLEELYDLPMGWQAVRVNESSPWQRVEPDDVSS
ncbi:MAG: hypothetical protein ACFCBU_18590 [Cyanophyceae cyanobacterium]